MESPIAYVTQPLPTPGQEAVLTILLWGWLGADGRELLADDLIARVEVGQAQYGTPLMTHNGRDAAQDWLEEAEDACMYAMQLCVESFYSADVVGLLQEQIELTKRIKQLVNRRKAGGIRGNRGWG